MLTCEAARNADALAGYLAKLAAEQDTPTPPGVGEVVKLTQLPVHAPRGFRRLRSSRGFLPPKPKASGEWTGELVHDPLPEKTNWFPTKRPPHPLAGEFEVTYGCSRARRRPEEAQ